jgi:beta-galactosidase
MFSPDRKPHPAVDEIKFLQQPVLVSSVSSALESSGIQVTVTDESKASVWFRVSNRYSFLELSHLTWSWMLKSNRSSEIIRSGRLYVPGKEPVEEVRLRLDDVISRVRTLERSKPALGNTYWLNVRGSLKEDTSWAAAGHVVVSHQFRLKFEFREMITPMHSPVKTASRTHLATSIDDNAIQVFRVVGGERREFAKIDKNTGALVSFFPHGRNAFASQGLVPNFVRAATDNDKGGMELALNFMMVPSWAQDIYYSVRGHEDCSYWSHWKKTGLDAASLPRVVCSRVRITDSSDSEKVGIVALCTVLSPYNQSELFKVKLHYCLFDDGRVRIANHVKPLRALRMTPSIPRVGMSMVLDPSLFAIQYYGRGPGENYPDRKTASEIGVYNTTPADMAYYDYIVPSENGSRSDCEYVAFRSKNGDGLCVVSTRPDGSLTTFNCSAILHSICELHEANHTCDLERRKNGTHPVHVNIDHELMGLGGDVRYEY